MHRPSIERKMSVKIRDEYEAVRHMAPPEIKPRDASNNNKNRARLAATTNDTNNNNNNSNKRFEKTIPGLAEAANLAAKNKRKLTDDDGSEKTDLASLIDSIDEPVRERIEANASGGIFSQAEEPRNGREEWCVGAIQCGHKRHFKVFSIWCKRKYEIERACDGKFSVQVAETGMEKAVEVIQSHLGTPRMGAFGCCGQIERVVRHWF